MSAITMNPRGNLMSKPKPSDPQDTLKALILYAATLMKSGSPDSQVEKALMDKGLSQSSARTMISQLRTVRRNVLRKAALRDLLMGGAICIIGLVITTGTNSAAVSPMGGTYYIAWGAMLFGALQCVRGVLRFMQR